MKLKIFNFLKSVKISRLNLNHKLFISLESNIEILVGVVTLAPSFPNIGILIHKQAILGKHFEHECINKTESPHMKLWVNIR